MSKEFAAATLLDSSAYLQAGTQVLEFPGKNDSAKVNHYNSTESSGK